MLCVEWVVFVLEGAGVTGLPVPAAVPVSFETGIGARAALPWHVRAAEVTVRGKRSDTQLCWASLS